MKKTCQISRRRAAEKFREFAVTSPTPIQLTFPLADVFELAQTSLGDLLRGVGKVFIESVMEAKVEQLAGRGRSQTPHGAPIGGAAKKGFASSMGSECRSRRPSGAPSSAIR